MARRMRDLLLGVWANLISGLRAALGDWIIREAAIRTGELATRHFLLLRIFGAGRISSTMDEWG